MQSAGDDQTLDYTDVFGVVDQGVSGVGCYISELRWVNDAVNF
jgi:hypothetical protein